MVMIICRCQGVELEGKYAVVRSAGILESDERNTGRVMGTKTGLSMSRFS